MRTKKAFYNIVTQMSYEIVAMVCGMILPRFMLSAFGSSYNGMISSITQFLDYISFLVLGVSNATRVALYQAIAENDQVLVSRILKATEQYMRKVAYAFTAYVIILAALYPNLVGNEFRRADSVSLIIIIAIGVFAEYFFGITYKIYLTANQCIYIYNIIHIGSKISNTLVSLFLMNMGQSIQVVKLGSAICFAATPILLNIVVRNRFHIIKDVSPDSSALKQRRDVIAHSIANFIHLNIDIFLLTLFTNPATVSVYSVYNLVLSSLRKLQNVFTTGLEAAFGDMWARKDFAKFENNFNTLEFLTFSFASIVFACTAVLILPFVKLYTKGITDINYVLPSYVAVAVLAESFFCIRTPYLIIVQAVGRYRETKNGAFIEAYLNFGVSTVAFFKFGLTGVIIGTLIANLFRTVQYSVYLSKHIIKRPVSCFFLRCLWAMFNMAVILGIHWLVLTSEITSWLGWILNALLIFFVSLAVIGLSAFFFFNNDLFSSINIFKRMVLGRRKP